MAFVADVSPKLAEYMMKGWILTSQTCKNPGCDALLLHSPPDGTPTMHMCVNCDDPADRLSTSSAHTSHSASTTMSESHHSRSSTPPTEASSTLSSPVFATPVETDESRRRREQSDRASSEIGKRLLKGWAMLAEECPNIHCYGIPLVRPPRSGDRKDPRKECVVCGGAYVAEIGPDGRERLVPVQLNTAGQYNNDATTISIPQKVAEDRMTGNERSTPVSMAGQVTPLVFAPASGHADPSQYKNSSKSVDGPFEALEESSSALQSTLRALSARIRQLSDPNNPADHSAIKVTADNISSVTKALSHVRQLQWSENQVRKF